MPILYLVVASIWAGAFASSTVRRRVRPAARTTRRRETVRNVQRPPRTSINGGYLTATDVPLSAVTGCPC